MAACDSNKKSNAPLLKKIKDKEMKQISAYLREKKTFEIRENVPILSKINIVEQGQKISIVDMGLDTKTNNLFVCGSNQVLVVNAKSKKIITSIKVGDEPSSLCLDDKKRRAYVITNKEFIVIDLDLELVAGSIILDTEPKHICHNPARQEAYVAFNDSGKVLVIDTKKLKVIETITIENEHPWAISIDKKGKHLYTANLATYQVSSGNESWRERGTISIIDLKKRKV